VLVIIKEMLGFRRFHLRGFDVKQSEMKLVVYMAKNLNECMRWQIAHISEGTNIPIKKSASQRASYFVGRKIEIEPALSATASDD